MALPFPLQLWPSAELPGRESFLFLRLFSQKLSSLFFASLLGVNADLFLRFRLTARRSWSWSWASSVFIVFRFSREQEKHFFIISSFTLKCFTSFAMVHAIISHHDIVGLKTSAHFIQLLINFYVKNFLVWSGKLKVSSSVVLFVTFSCKQIDSDYSQQFLTNPVELFDFTADLSGGWSGSGTLFSQSPTFSISCSLFFCSTNESKLFQKSPSLISKSHNFFNPQHSKVQNQMNPFCWHHCKHQHEQSETRAK